MNVVRTHQAGKFATSEDVGVGSLVPTRDNTAVNLIRFPAMNTSAAPATDIGLWSRIRDRSVRALATGALVRIATQERRIVDAGVSFIVRSVSSLARKHWDSLAPPANPTARTANPFLPYDRDLFVSDVGPSHVCLLNKFPVIDGHILIVTRAFEHQDRLLTRSDVEALLACLLPIGGLGFYNGGAAAGASQPHKHLQVVPLPLATDGPAVPMAARLDLPLLPPGAPSVAELPFHHRLVRLDARRMTGPDGAAPYVHDLYRRMLAALDIGETEHAGEPRASNAYNMLMTTDWLMVVPRLREHRDSISVNALGFAGSLFVRDEREMNLVEAAGPMAVLRDVGIAR